MASEHEEEGEDNITLPEGEDNITLSEEEDNIALPAEAAMAKATGLATARDQWTPADDVIAAAFAGNMKGSGGNAEMADGYSKEALGEAPRKDTWKAKQTGKVKRAGRANPAERTINR